jgi:hypothetical protein
MPTPKVNSWLGWRIFTVNTSLATPLPDGDPAAVQHRGLGLGALEIERDGSLPQQPAGADPAGGRGVEEDWRVGPARQWSERGGQTRPYESTMASYTTAGGPQTASVVQNDVFQTSAEL